MDTVYIMCYFSMLYASILFIVWFRMSKKEWYALQRANKLREAEQERMEYQQRNQIVIGMLFHY